MVLSDDRRRAWCRSSLIPNAVEPLAGEPGDGDAVAVDGDVASTPTTVIPTPVVPVTVKPWTITQLRLEIENPLLPPVRVTVAPGAVVKVTGAVAVPELTTVTFSG